MELTRSPLGLSLLYRGSLSSCNYSCSYCPFGKAGDDRQSLDQDAAEVGRFVDWVRAAERPISVFFTPWGEALIRRSYQQALVTLSQLPHLRKVAIQTNLSANLDFIEAANVSKLGLWCTFHPSQTTLERFLAQCQSLVQAGVSLSVGMVALKEDLEAARALRAALPEGVYLWLNAYKDLSDYYAPEDLTPFEAIDPLFRLNLRDHPSRGRRCFTGETSLVVRGDGEVRRCHFVEEWLGNLYQQPLGELLGSRPCPNEVCSCHIGYVHLAATGAQHVFADGLLERVPKSRKPSLPVLT